jgi:hypothetical protein
MWPRPQPGSTNHREAQKAALAAGFAAVAACSACDMAVIDMEASYSSAAT